jgi:uncharacterized protein
VIREAQVWDETGREVGRFQVCARPLARLRGLMFRRDLPVDGLLFVFPAWRRHPRAVGIHTFFVFFPFAAIWLDEEGRIVHAVEARPFRAYAPPRPARYLIEGRPEILTRARVGAQLVPGDPGDGEDLKDPVAGKLIHPDVQRAVAGWSWSLPRWRRSWAVRRGCGICSEACRRLLPRDPFLQALFWKALHSRGAPGHLPGRAIRGGVRAARLRELL